MEISLHLSHIQEFQAFNETNLYNFYTLHGLNSENKFLTVIFVVKHTFDSFKKHVS